MLETFQSSSAAERLRAASAFVERAPSATGTMSLEAVTNSFGTVPFLYSD